MNKSAQRDPRARNARRRGIDPEWLSSTIGAIYDCALQPENWRRTLEAIAGEFLFASAVLDIVRPHSATNFIQFEAGIDTEYFALFGDYIADSIDLWGGRKVLETWPLEEPAVANQIIHIERKRKNRYYVDVLEPRGFTDGVVIPLARDKDLFCYLGLNRHVSHGDVTPEDAEGLRLLSPHLRRAVTIGNLLDLKAIERATFESVLSAMTHGVVLVDESLHVVHANPPAMEMTARNLVVGVKNGKFIAHGLHAQTALQLAVQLSAENESQISRRGIGVPAKGADGTMAVLHVLPLNKGMIRPGLVQRTVAAIFVTTPEQSVYVPIDAISLLYDFTPAESLIFSSLAKGISLEQTADALGVAKSTARTHLLRLFDKTGCKRQAELVALASRHATSI